MGVFFYENLALYEKQIYENERSKKTALSEMIRNSLTALMLEGKGKRLQDFLASAEAEDLEAVRLIGKDNIVRASSIPSEIGSRMPGMPYPSEQGPAVLAGERKGRKVYAVLMPIYNEKSCRRCHGAKEDLTGFLSAEFSMRKTLEALNDLRRKAVLTYLFAIAAISVSMGVLTFILLNKPIGGIIETMKKAQGGALDARFMTKRTDEIGSLASSLNSMLSELGRARKEVEHCHLEAIQKVEKMATIGELAAAIAHEIKNPLAGISGAIQVLAEDFHEEDPRKDIIKEVLNEIERLDKAVKDLLNFARPPEIHPIKTMISHVIERSRRLVAVQAQRQNVNISVDSKGEMEEIYVDPEQMQQVFLNIMLNALHSMPGGGELLVSVDSMAEDGSAHIIFRDTGHGISHDDLRSIFKPFFTTKHIGAGLGLAISKGIVERHGGTITVESQVGIGSIFRVVLPGRQTKDV